MSTDTAAVFTRRYRKAGGISEIYYFPEGPGGYGDCPALKLLGCPRMLCRASVKDGKITRTYAGLVGLSDPRASAIHRYVAGSGELAYMRGSFKAYNVVRRDFDFTPVGHHYIRELHTYFYKRLSGSEGNNLHIHIKSSGGKGAIVVYGNDRKAVSREEISFNAEWGETDTQEFYRLIDTGYVVLTWDTEVLGSTLECWVEYPGDTPV